MPFKLNLKHGNLNLDYGNFIIQKESIQDIQLMFEEVNIFFMTENCKKTQYCYLSLKASSVYLLSGAAPHSIAFTLDKS